MPSGSTYDDSMTSEARAERERQMAIAVRMCRTSIRISILRSYGAGRAAWQIAANSFASSDAPPIMNAQKVMGICLRKPPMFHMFCGSRCSAEWDSPAPEWSPCSRDGGIGAAIGDQARTRSVIQQLTFSIERGRNLGIGL